VTAAKGKGGSTVKQTVNQQNGNQQQIVSQDWSDQPVGRPKVISEQYLSRLKELVDGNPRDFGYPFQRWTAQWLKRHLARETGVEVSDRHINRLLKQMGLSTRTSVPSGARGSASGWYHHWRSLPFLRFSWGRKSCHLNTWF
jgi:transposase